MLHLDSKAEPESLPKSVKADDSEKPPTDKVVSHFANNRQRSVLLMTCQVVSARPDDYPRRGVIVVRGNTLAFKPQLPIAEKAQAVTNRQYTE